MYYTFYRYLSNGKTVIVFRIYFMYLGGIL